MIAIEVTDRELAVIQHMRLTPAERLAKALAAMTPEERAEYDRRSALSPAERQVERFQRMAATAEVELAKPELAAVAMQMAAKMNPVKGEGL